jgi:hypothetical protein
MRRCVNEFAGCSVVVSAVNSDDVLPCHCDFFRFPLGCAALVSTILFNSKDKRNGLQVPRAVCGRIV